MPPSSSVLWILFGLKLNFKDASKIQEDAKGAEVTRARDVQCYYTKEPALIAVHLDIQQTGRRETNIWEEFVKRLVTSLG